MIGYDISPVSQCLFFLEGFDLCYEGGIGYDSAIDVEMSTRFMVERKLSLQIEFAE